jgi:uncharacterized membrane protein YuzA (DUF378 family)
MYGRGSLLTFGKNKNITMQYWIYGNDSPLTLRQIQDQKHRLSPTTRCAVVGSNEWGPIKDIIPGLFDGTIPDYSESDISVVLPKAILFSQKSGWVTFFYVLAVLNAVCGLLVGVFASPIVGIIAGFSSFISCLFFAFVSQVLVDIRWLLSRK